MTTLELKSNGLQELDLNEMLEIDGGKFWDTVGGKILMAFLVGVAGALGAALVDEVF